MKIHHSILVVATIASFVFSVNSFAGPKTYQVTGPVLAVTDTSITVQKGDEKWEVARDGKTKITGEVKVGGKVTIEYTMNAISVEAKADAAAAKPAKKK
jgi:hypothetical protein